MKAIIILFLMSVSITVAENPSVLWSYDIDDNAFGCSAAGDIDNDGKLEIVLSTYRNDGNVYALNSEDGSLLWKYDIGDCSDAAPLIYDVDGDGLLDVVVSSSCMPYMYCFNGLDGALKWKVQTRGTDSPPSAQDINNDGIVEIYNGDFRGFVTSYNGTNGEIIWETHIKNGYFLQTAPVIVDINNDNIFEIIVATYNLDSLCSVYALNSDDGSIIWESEDKFYSVYHAPVVVDIDDDGKLEAVFSDFKGYLSCIDAESGKTKWQYNLENCSNSLSPTTIADLDNDNSYEIIYFCDQYLNVIDKHGELLWNFKMINGISAFRGGITVDVNNDNILDIVFGNYLGELTAVSGKDGSLIWLMNFFDIYGEYFDVSSGLVASDFNGDGLLDIFVTGGWTHIDYKENYGKAYMITTNSKGVPDWLMFRNNTSRNGFIPKSAINSVSDDSNILQITPNPASEYIEMTFYYSTTMGARAVGVHEIKIYNTFGTCVMTESIHQMAPSHRLNIEHLPIGLYFIKIGNYAEKFVVLR